MCTLISRLARRKLNDVNGFGFLGTIISSISSYPELSRKDGLHFCSF